MPVATLRVWERRYGMTQTALSPAGQRLYSAADVRRLTLLKQLVDLGHAIGSLAQQDMPQLQRVAAMHAQTLAATHSGMLTHPDVLPPLRAWRLALIGPALATRVRRPAVLRRLGRPVELLGPFVNVAQAAAALRAGKVDALLLHEPQLQADWLEVFNTAAPAFASLPKAVLYGFAADAVCESLANHGLSLLREPQPDVVIAQWLRGLAAADSSTAAAEQPRPAAASLPTRRWDDAALADFASLSPAMACECPRHVSELLMQLAHFEAYSAECENRNEADAQLHAHLRNVAASCRARFEAALEHVALHEGLLLPASAG